MLHSGPPGGHASGAAYLFERTETGWVETQKLKASDGVTQDQFGEAVSLSGDTAAVAAPNNDDLGGDSGSVYVIERVGAAWLQVANLHASDGASGDGFGHGVALRGDTLVVGADDNGGTGAAYVFERIGGTWIQTAELTASDGALSDQFGFAVGLSGDTAVVGAHCDDDGGSCTGSVYVFERTGGLWGPDETAKLHAGDPEVQDLFGVSVSIDGNRIAVGADTDDDRGDSAGSAYVFERGASGWVQVAKLLAHDGARADLFGLRVSISGNAVLAGSPLDDDACPEDEGCESGAAYVFRITGVASAYCFGTGCPCRNDDPVAGCATSRGSGGRLTACGSASTAADDLVLQTSGLPPISSRSSTWAPASSRSPSATACAASAPAARGSSATSRCRAPVRSASSPWAPGSSPTRRRASPPPAASTPVTPGTSRPGSAIRPAPAASRSTCPTRSR